MSTNLARKLIVRVVVLEHWRQSPRVPLVKAGSVSLRLCLVAYRKQTPQLARSAYGESLTLSILPRKLFTVDNRA